MILPAGTYHYEIGRSGQAFASEETSFDGRKISGWRKSIDGTIEMDAEVDDGGIVLKVRLRYVRGPFSRNASYEAGESFLRGSVSALGGRNAVTAKLGRFREVDADFTIFRALILAHIRARGQVRWTGRVATIDSGTLVAASNKQSARAVDSSGLKWTYEARMGDVDEIELDEDGRIVHRRDNRGSEVRLVSG